MIRLIRAEYRKLRSTQVWFWMLLVCIGLTSLFVIAQIANSSNQGLHDNARDILISATGGLTYVPLFILGILAVTTEYRYQTITPTVLATPSRWAIITAKFITYALIGAAYSAVCVVVELAIALPWYATRGVDLQVSSNISALLAAFLVLALFALVGVGFGALIKNQIVAVSVGVAFLLIIDRLLIAIPGVRNVFPYTLDGAVSSIVIKSGGDRTVNGVHLLHAGGGIAVLIAWALVTAAIGAGITMNRDIT
jgi:ABC-2 type transport system permease protein